MTKVPDGAPPLPRPAQSVGDASGVTETNAAGGEVHPSQVSDQPLDGFQRGGGTQFPHRPGVRENPEMVPFEVRRADVAPNVYSLATQLMPNYRGPPRGVLTPRSMHHDFNDAAIWNYVTAETGEQRDAAIEQLRQLAMNPGNPSAESALRDLMRLDAALRITEARSLEDRQRGLERLAVLSLDSDPRANDLMGLPGVEPGDYALTREAIREERTQLARRNTNAVTQLRNGPRQRIVPDEQLRQLAEDLVRRQEIAPNDTPREAARWARGYLAQRGLEDALARDDQAAAAIHLRGLMDAAVAGAEGATLPPGSARALQDLEGRFDPVNGIGPGDAAQAMQDLRATLPPSRPLRSDELLKLLGTVEEQDAARESATQWLAANQRRAIEAYDAFLSAATPQERQQALVEIGMTRELRQQSSGADLFAQPHRWARAADATLSLREARDTQSVRAALAELAALNRDGVLLANQTLGALRSAGKDIELLSQELEDPRTTRSTLEWLKSNTPDITQEIGRQRVTSVLRGVTKESTSGDLSQVLTRLHALREEGIEAAAPWVPWAQVAQATARIEESTNFEEAQQAVSQLAAMSTQGSPEVRAHATRALAATLLAEGGGERSLSVDARTVQHWHDLGYATVDDKPVFLPRVPEHLTSEQHAQLVQAAAASLASRTDLDAGALTAVAAAYSRASEAGEVDVATRLRATLDGNPSTAAIADALRNDWPGADHLVEPFLSRSSDRDFKDSLRSLEGTAHQGNPAAVRVFANLLADPALGHGEDAARLFRAAPDGPLGERYASLLLDTYRARTEAGTGDRGSLLETLGTVAAEQSGTDRSADLLRDVRSTLRSALSSDNVHERRSASYGLLAFRGQLSDADVQAMLAAPSAEMAQALRAHGSELAEPVQAALHAGLVEQLRAPATPPARGVAAAQMLSMLGHRLERGDVDVLAGFASRLEGDPKHTVAVAMTQIPGLSRDSGVQEHVVTTLLDRPWGLERSDLRGLVALARGEPDAVFSDRIARLVYRVGIPRPLAGVFRGAGVAGSSQELQVLARNALEHHDRVEIDRIMSRVALVNAMPHDMRQEVTGSAEAIDPRQVIYQMSMGVLSEAPTGILADQPRTSANIDQRARAYLRRANGDVRNAQQQVRDLRRERESLVRELGRHTREGVSLLDRVGSVFGDPDLYDFINEQGNLVARLRHKEGQIARAAEAIVEPSQRQSQADFALRAYQHASTMARGQTDRADRQLLQMWGEYGNDLPGFMLEELNRSGDSLGDMGAWARLRFNDRVQTEEMPQLRAGSAEGVNDALRTLSLNSRSTGEERHPVRQNALRAIDSDPTIAQLSELSGEFAEQMLAVQTMYTDGMAGSRYEEFVTDARQRARSIKNVLRQGEALHRQTQQTISTLERGLRDISDPTARREVESRIDALKQAAEIFDPNSEANDKLNELTNLMLSDAFDETTFANWLKKDGPIVAGAIAGAVALTVVTCGAGAPLLLVATVSTAGGILGAELTSEALHHMRRGGLTDLGRGRSRLGGYIESSVNGHIVNEYSGAIENPRFWQDVAGPYTWDFIRGFAITAATMGAGHFLSSNINRGAQALSQRLSLAGRKSVERVTARMQSVQNQLAKAGSAAEATLMRRFAREYVEEMVDEVLETTAQEGVKAALGRADARLQFLATLMVATGKGIRLSGTANPSVIEFDGDMDTMVQTLQQEGHLCRVENDLIHVTSYTGANFVVGRSGSPQLQTLMADPRLPTAGPAPTRGSPVAEGATGSVSQARQHLETMVANLRQGDNAAALAAAEARLQELDARSDVRVVRPEVAISEETARILADPGHADHQAQLSILLGRVAGAANVMPHRDDGSRASVYVPRIVVQSGEGRVDLFDADADSSGPSADVEQAQALRESLLRSSAADRLRVEQTIATMEEYGHIAQSGTHADPQTNVDGIASPTYAAYLSQRVAELEAEGRNDEAAQLRSSVENGDITGAMREQELVALLYDSGMSIAELEHHFSQYHSAARAPVFDFLRSREGMPTRWGTRSNVDGTQSVRPATEAGEVTGDQATQNDTDPVRALRTRLEEITSRPPYANEDGSPAIPRPDRVYRGFAGEAFTEQSVLTTLLGGDGISSRRVDEIRAEQEAANNDLPPSERRSPAELQNEARARAAQEIMADIDERGLPRYIIGQQSATNRANTDVRGTTGLAMSSNVGLAADYAIKSVEGDGPVFLIEAAAESNTVLYDGTKGEYYVPGHLPGSQITGVYVGYPGQNTWFYVRPGEGGTDVFRAEVSYPEGSRRPTVERGAWLARVTPDGPASQLDALRAVPGTEALASALRNASQTTRGDAPAVRPLAEGEVRSLGNNRYRVRVRGTDFIVRDEALEGSGRQLRVEHAPDGEGHLVYDAHQHEGEVVSVTLGALRGVPRGEGPPGAGQALKQTFLHVYGNGPEIHSFLSETNESRMQELLRDNPRPTIEALQEAVPALSFDGFDYRLSFDRGFVVLRMTPRTDGGTRSRLVNPEVFDTETYREYLRDDVFDSGEAADAALAQANRTPRRPGSQPSVQTLEIPTGFAFPAQGGTARVESKTSDGEYRVTGLPGGDQTLSRTALLELMPETLAARYRQADPAHVTRGFLSALEVELDLDGLSESDATALDSIARGQTSGLTLDHLSPELRTQLSPGGALFEAVASHRLRTGKETFGPLRSMLALHRNRRNPGPILLSVLEAQHDYKESQGEGYRFPKKHIDDLSHAVTDGLQLRLGGYLNTQEVPYDRVAQMMYRLEFFHDRSQWPALLSPMLEAAQIDIEFAGDAFPPDVAQARVDQLRQHHQAPATRNVAFLSSTIDGVRGEATGISRGPDGFGHMRHQGSLSTLPPNGELLLGETSREDGRLYDPERVMLENLARQLTTQNPARTQAGTVNLYSERPLCGACQMAVARFQQMFPNIRVVIQNGEPIRPPSAKRPRQRVE